jgi:hypothetical protein
MKKPSLEYAFHLKTNGSMSIECADIDSDEKEEIFTKVANIVMPELGKKWLERKISRRDMVSIIREFETLVKVNIYCGNIPDHKFKTINNGFLHDE